MAMTNEERARAVLEPIFADGGSSGDRETDDEMIEHLATMFDAVRHDTIAEAFEAEWMDVDDEWSAEIKKAFPTNSGSHAEYATAMEMVGNRHSKGELVALVNWLLVKCRDAAQNKGV
jgi:hypothetical protein